MTLVAILGIGMLTLCISSPPAPTVELTDHEITWWGIADQLLVIMRSNGDAECIGFDGRRHARFRVDDYKRRDSSLAIVGAPEPLLAVATRGAIHNQVRFLSLADGAIRATMQIEQSPGMSLDAVSPDGRLLFCDCRLEGRVFAIDVGTKSVIWTDSQDPVVSGVAF